MTKTFWAALFVSVAMQLGVAGMFADAQPYGPGQGGMMGSGWGWGMGWGMGGFGGFGLIAAVLLVVGLAFVVSRRRNS